MHLEQNMVNDRNKQNNRAHKIQSSNLDIFFYHPLVEFYCTFLRGVGGLSNTSPRTEPQFQLSIWDTRRLNWDPVTNYIIYIQRKLPVVMGAPSKVQDSLLGVLGQIPSGPTIFCLNILFCQCPA